MPSGVTYGDLIGKAKPVIPVKDRTGLALPIKSPYVTPLGIVLYFQILYIFLCIRYFWQLPDDCSARSMKL